MPRVKQPAVGPEAETGLDTVANVEVEAEAEIEAPKPKAKTVFSAVPARYLIITENHAYTGKVFGVQIESGVGLLDPVLVNPRLGHTFQDIATELRQRAGYTLLPLGANDNPTLKMQELRAEWDKQDQARADILKAMGLVNSASAEKFIQLLQSQVAG